MRVYFGAFLLCVLACSLSNARGSTSPIDHCSETDPLCRNPALNVPKSPPPPHREPDPDPRDPVLPPPDQFYNPPVVVILPGGAGVPLFPPFVSGGLMPYAPPGSFYMPPTSHIECVPYVMQLCNEAGSSISPAACEQAIWQFSEGGRDYSGDVETVNQAKDLVRRAQSRCASQIPKDIHPSHPGDISTRPISAPGLFDIHVLQHVITRVGSLVLYLCGEVLCPRAAN